MITIPEKFKYTVTLKDERNLYEYDLYINYLNPNIWTKRDFGVPVGPPTVESVPSLSYVISTILAPEKMPLHIETLKLTFGISVTILDPLSSYIAFACINPFMVFVFGSIALIVTVSL